MERCALPEMHVGDWMLFENMGAYTVAAASTFNGFQRPTVYYVMPGPAWLVAARVSGPDKSRDLGALSPRSMPVPLPGFSPLADTHLPSRARSQGSGGWWQLVLG